MPDEVRVKGPNDRLDYGVDYSGFLPADDAITGAEWTAPADLTISEPGMVDGVVHRAFVSGGEIGRTYRVTSRITTAQGREREQSFYVLILEG